MFPNQNIRQQENTQISRLADSDFVDNFSAQFIEDSSDGVYSPRIITLDSSTDLIDSFHSDESYSYEYTSDYEEHDDYDMLDFIQDSLSYINSTDEIQHQRDIGAAYRNANSSNVDSDSGNSDLSTHSSNEIHLYRDYQPQSDTNTLGSNNIENSLRRLQEQDDSEIVIVESVDLSNFLQSMGNDFMIMLLNRIYMAYTLLVYNFELEGVRIPNTDDSIQLAETIGRLSEMELKSLKDKVSKLLMADINDAAIVQSLVELISVDKIDKIGTLQLRNSRFTTVLYKDMLDSECKSCGICYSNFKPLHKCTSLRCWHTFHTKCIKKWVSVTWCCPLCRRKDIC
ncbi:hypothetical protein GINT2_001320 [Glugoides intestinalis]